jgi:hypothetical protein
MTYQEILKKLADQTADTYNAYLQAKISGLSDSDTSIADKTEQHRAEAERLEKKLVALIATIKNDESISKEASEDFYEDFIK